MGLVDSEVFLTRCPAPTGDRTRKGALCFPAHHHSKAHLLLNFGNVQNPTWTWLCSEVKAIYLSASFSVIEGAKMLFHAPPEVTFLGCHGLWGS